jgi:DNA-binding NtrC family response regulator
MKPSDRQAPFTIGLSASGSLSRIVRLLVDDLPSGQIESVTVASLCSRKSGNASHSLLIIEAVNEGTDLIAAMPTILQRHPRSPVLAVSETTDHRIAVRLVQAGVRDVLTLPAEQHRLYDLVEKMLRERDVLWDQQTFVDVQVQSYDFSRLIGSSPSFLATIARAQKVAGNSALTVLILGETGTGKGMLAKAIHYNSGNRVHPFIEIGCSSLPETLLESELFGHEKGAFTDARDRKIGLFELAGQGTIFLDEIGDISQTVQSKLLKVLEEKLMRRVGGVQDIHVSARIIAATSRDLTDLVRKGIFRSDLFYRLNVVPLTLPPLRDRREDIPGLIAHFLARFNEMMGAPPHQLTAAAREKLQAHDWNGNVRELMHALERAVILAEDSVIDADSLDLSAQTQRSVAAIHAPNMSPEDLRTGDQITLRLPFQEATIMETERHLVREILRHVHGNKSRAAAFLQISRPRLERILKHDPEFFRSVLKQS